jgi:hypothetical protein
VESSAESRGFCEAWRDVAGKRGGGRRLIEAGLSEAAVGLALWAECLGALAAATIAVGDPTWRGADIVGGARDVWAAVSVVRPPDVTGRTMVDGW